MSGKSYQISMAPSAYRRYKRNYLYFRSQRNRLCSEIWFNGV